MADVFINIPNSGSPQWKSPVDTAANLPSTGNANGDARIAKDSDTLYVWNGSTWVPVASPGAVTAITALIGDVTANGPGAAPATVNFVGGVSAANVASGSNLANASTSSNTPNTIVKRDGSGNFSAGIITASLTGNVTGNVSGSSSSFTGPLLGDVTGTQGATVISDTTVTGKLLTGYVVGTNTPLAATDSILLAFGKVQGQLSATSGSAITALTGDATATGPGSVPITFATVNGNVGTFGSSTSIPTFTVNAKGLITAASSNVVIAPAGTLTGTTLASNVVTSSLTSVGILTSLTVSGTISASNFSGSSSGTNTGDQTITLSGDISGSGTGAITTTLATVNSNVGSFGSSTAIPSFTVNAKGLITAATSNVVIAPAGTLTGTTLAANVVNSSLTSVGTLTSLTVSGAISASNFSGSSSGTNTGDVTLTAVGAVPNANAASLSGQVLNLQPANASFPGVVTTLTQTFAGDKTFTGSTISKSLQINGTAGTGFINYVAQSSNPATPVSGISVFADATGRFSQKNTGGFVTTFDSSGITGDRVYTLRDVSGKFVLDSRLSLLATTISTSPVTILNTDGFAVYLVDTSAARTINLPTATSVADRAYIFKDIIGTAETNNISIVPNGTDQIEGLNVTKLLQTNYGSWTFLSDGVSKWWMI